MTQRRRRGQADERRAAAARMVGLIEKHRQNPDPLDLTPELALLRALAEDLMERWDSIYGEGGAVEAWHESFQRGDPVAAKPHQLADVSSVTQIIARVGAMVDRIRRHRESKVVTLADLNRWLNLLGMEVVEAVRDVGLDDATGERLLTNLEARWCAVRVEVVQ